LFVALEALEQIFHQNFAVYRPTLDRLREIQGGQLFRSDAVARVVGFMAKIAGDHATAIEADETGSAVGWDSEALRLLAESTRLVQRGAPAPEALGVLLARTDRLGPGFRAATVLTGLAVAALVVDLPRAGQIARRSLDLHAPGSSAWLGTFNVLPIWHALREEPEQALHATVQSVEVATQLGERSALVPPLVAHALVLQSLDAPIEAAIVRAAVPRRWSIYAPHVQRPLDDWLDSRLDADERTRLEHHARGLTLNELFAIAPEALRSTTLRPPP
jgi:hypothetical protein